MQKSAVMKAFKITLTSLALSAMLGLSSAFGAGAVVSFGGSSIFGGNDDGSVGPVNLGLSANFFGTTYTQAYLNNNGNMTFGFPLGTFTPFGLTANTGIPIIAPFFGDVDTRGGGTQMTYGTGTFAGHNAFHQTWDGVGFYFVNSSKLNTFQTILVDRSDTGSGNFDIYFNYDQIQWETGDASGGSNGLGGTSAHVGYSNGTGIAGSNFEMAGSGVNGAFLDSGPAGTSLIHNTNMNANDPLAMDGRYLFTVRNGVVTPGNVPDSGSTVALLGLAFAGLVALKRKRA